ncbi:hypothetical protein BRC72_06555 [Halobacteriales archaeon QH_7_66_36]|jgi:hypothetical protein|nr:MAG: hypothetical protein BRC72_06555 [Halobacteriales archaeon QH_7_66_36]
MSDTQSGDDREWNDPPGVDIEESDDEKGALDVATEGESFIEVREREPLTPGDISLENALFVVLGAAVTVLVLAQLVI